MRQLSLLLALLSLPALGGTCESLLSLKLPHASVTKATSEIDAREYSAPAAKGASPNSRDLPAFCRVALTLTPSDDSDIKIEIWMPAEKWNGKFEGTANGAYAGRIDEKALAGALLRGYAAANTDTGHTGNGGSFAVGHPEKVIDFGYRAVHEMSVTAKAVVTEFYGVAPKLSYWNGCSTGGRQALQEAQKYPADYDGIVAGAPANNTTRMTMMQLNVAQAVHKDEASYLPATKFKLIHDAAMAACDASDGVRDGVLENPTRCKFDPKVLACKIVMLNKVAVQFGSGDCLTAPQLAAVQRIYGSTINPDTKEYIFPGLEPGSELGWAMMIGPEPFSYANDFWKFMVMKDPAWDYKTLNFETDLARALKEDHGVVDATDANLAPFFARGKLIQYHGWNDPGIAPENSVNYYNKVVDTLGGLEKTKDQYRLFMVPGMAHCRGGEGTDTFDMLAALERWREQGTAPQQITASRLKKNGAVERTRPLCPYPQQAVYSGKGSTDDAVNFTCKVP